LDIVAWLHHYLSGNKKTLAALEGATRVKLKEKRRGSLQLDAMSD
jgi:hypothetical protein